MEHIYVLVIVIVVCNLWLYNSLKNKIEELKSDNFKIPPINITCTPQLPQTLASGVLPATSPPAFPVVSVSPAPATDDEMAAVVMAAIAAYESDVEAGMGDKLSSFVPSLTESPPALVHESEKYKYQRRDNRWAATARYENHKRL